MHTGILRKIVLLYHKKLEKNFAILHRRELKEVYDMLADEKSKRVFENVLKYRINGGDYLRTLEINENDQYFVPEIRFSDQEVIVDCGAYTGDTVEKFFKLCPPPVSVIALEPDEESFNVLSSLQFDGLKTYQYGVWSEDAVLCFMEGSGTANSVVNNGNINIEVRALDNLPECRKATYIKMDVEGSELEALKGAESIIRKNRPKLAICIYHKIDDYFMIPLYLKSLDLNYKFYVYHHSYGRGETVLYAT